MVDTVLRIIHVMHISFTVIISNYRQNLRGAIIMYYRTT